MAKAIMIQGSMSNVGKSLMVAGLCRIFAQDGYKVAPFKSQNMALNSYVTADGREMGRAQVMQAEAAGVEPEVRMNPILLKPNSDTGSQVVIMGEPREDMGAAVYHAYKKNLRDVVARAYAGLTADYDIVVLEGAGSPAEINLREHDIVNMGMAEMAESPVLLVGDIDPGGVFAQLYGTLGLLSQREQDMVKGLIVNRFRGDVGILRPGLQDLERLCQKPVLGVVPYMKLDLDDEDSLSTRLTVRNHEKLLDVAVIRLPHISNFTDFISLARHTALGLRYVDRAEALGRPDLLILPGSKNTMGDLAWLKESGLSNCVLALARGGTPVIGICGGYQMLGQELTEPGGGTAQGLGLLPMNTVFGKEKVRRRAKGHMCAVEGFFAPLAGLPVEGYEIHMGENTAVSRASGCRLQRDGCEYSDGTVEANVLGTYLHGFFDSSNLTEALVGTLMQARGLPYEKSVGLDIKAYKERQYDRLAEGLRAALDMPRIYEILRAGV